MEINGNTKVTWQFMLLFIALIVAYFVLSMNGFDKNITRYGFIILLVGLIGVTFGKKKE